MRHNYENGQEWIFFAWLDIQHLLPGDRLLGGAGIWHNFKICSPMITRVDHSGQLAACRDILVVLKDPSRSTKVVWICTIKNRDIPVVLSDLRRYLPGYQGLACAVQNGQSTYLPTYLSTYLPTCGDHSFQSASIEYCS